MEIKFERKSMLKRFANTRMKALFFFSFVLLSEPETETETETDGVSEWQSVKKRTEKSVYYSHKIRVVRFTYSEMTIYERYNVRSLEFSAPKVDTVIA